MKALALTLTAFMLFAGAAEARIAEGVFADLGQSAPRSAFDTLRDSAPRSVFADLGASAPRSAESSGGALDLLGE